MRYLLPFALCLAGCSSVSMPNLSGIAAPFRNEVQAGVGDTPKVSAAPVRPGDDRAAREWDSAAAELMRERDALSPPPTTDPYDLREVEAAIDAAQAEVNAYRADDPPGGVR